MTYDDPLSRELMTARDRELFPSFDWLELPSTPTFLNNAIAAYQDELLKAMAIPARFLEARPGDLALGAWPRMRRGGRRG